MSWREKIGRFFYGRYGMDALYRFCFGTVLVLIVLSSLLRRHMVASLVVSLLAWGLLIWSAWRGMSRNYARRRAENERFLRLIKPFKSFFVLQFRRVRDCRTRVYRKCPVCHAVLCLPRKSGRHTVRCPGCHHSWEVRVLGNGRGK